MGKLVTRDLRLYYGDLEALHGISMRIEKQSSTALIGPSGCGKSTFLRALNRMNDIIPGARAEGEVMLDGQNAITSLHDAPAEAYLERKTAEYQALQAELAELQAEVSGDSESLYGQADH